MAEYIVRETGYPGAVKQEIVEEIVRCCDCKNHNWCSIAEAGCFGENGFCCRGEMRKDK